jgi:hypothetical protein
MQPRGEIRVLNGAARKVAIKPSLWILADIGEFVGTSVVTQPIFLG